MLSARSARDVHDLTQMTHSTPQPALIRGLLVHLAGCPGHHWPHHRLTHTLVVPPAMAVAIRRCRAWLPSPVQIS